MRYITHWPARFIAYGLALALAVAVSATQVWSGGEPGSRQVKPGPRWSNDQHHDSGVVVEGDCVRIAPDLDPRYQAGRDAWGRPVIPAGPGRTHGRELPLGVDFDIVLKEKRIAGRPVDLTAGRFTFDPATRELALNGHPLTEDCVPSVK